MNPGRTLKPLSSIINTPLRWTQPSFFKSVYKLTAGEECFLILTSPKFFSTAMLAEAAEGRWELRQAGFWNPRVEIRREGDHLPIATCTMEGWMRDKGVIDLPKGRKLTVTASRLTFRYDVTTATGEPIMTLKNKIGFKASSELTLLPKSSSYPELPWVTALLWYLVLLARRRAARAG